MLLLQVYEDLPMELPARLSARFGSAEIEMACKLLFESELRLPILPRLPLRPCLLEGKMLMYASLDFLAPTYMRLTWSRLLLVVSAAVLRELPKAVRVCLTAVTGCLLNEERVRFLSWVGRLT